MSATRPLHLAVALDGPAQYDATYYVDLARLAERGTLDFVTLGDSFARPGLDALAVLSRVAPGTERIGLVPTVTTTHTEPLHVSASVATLDWVSRGRAGWMVGVSATAAEARLFGRRPAAPPAPARGSRSAGRSAVAGAVGGQGAVHLGDGDRDHRQADLGRHPVRHRRRPRRVGADGRRRRLRPRTASGPGRRRRLRRPGRAAPPGTRRLPYRIRRCDPAVAPGPPRPRRAIRKG